MNILVFDIETIPDCAGIRRLHDLPASLPDAEVAEVAFQKRRAPASSVPSGIAYRMPRALASRVMRK